MSQETGDIHVPKPSRVTSTFDRPGVNLVQIAELAAASAARFTQFQGIATILDWLHAVYDPKAPTIAVTWYDFLAMFQLHTGEIGVCSASTHNTWKLQSRHVQYSAQRMCHHWASFFTHMFRLGDKEFRPAHMRPHCFRYQCWAMGFYTKMSEAAQRGVQAWHSEVLADKAITSVKQLATLGPATRELPPTGARGLQIGLHRYFGRSV